MVKVWAEKETRNLNRYVRLLFLLLFFRSYSFLFLFSFLFFGTHIVICRMKLAGIPCPLPVVLRSHVLVMNFIGKDGRYPVLFPPSLLHPSCPPILLSSSPFLPLFFTLNILLLSIRAAPRLKDAEMSEEKARELYLPQPSPSCFVCCSFFWISVLLLFICFYFYIFIFLYFYSMFF